MNFDTPPNLKEFTRLINEYVQEIGCMYNNSGKISSHDIIGRISVYNEDEDIEYDITAIEIDRLLGCGCPDGLTIVVKKS